jgi:methylmalonyl-CoA mutase
MIRNDLQHIQLDSQKSKQEPALHEQEAPTAAFFTAEGIELKPTYSEQDIENLDLDFGAGFSLFTRSLYYYVCASPWTIRQYAGFSTAEESTFIDVILLQDKRTILLSICRHTVGMIQITNA